MIQANQSGSGLGGPLPVFEIRDSDNLTLREQLQLPENLAGKSVLTKDNNTMYSLSDSGVIVLPVGSLNAIPRVSASVEDLVFRGNLCDRTVSRQTFTISDPGGANVPFSVASGTPGITVSPASGITPATITVSVDPNFFATQKGTSVASIAISSGTAVNLPPSIRVLINSMDPVQRGTFVNVPGKIVDLAVDSKRGVYYVMRQDRNQIQVYNASNQTLKTTLRTCTKPMGMAMSFDQRNMLVGCDHSRYMQVWDLDQMIQVFPIRVPEGYVQSLAVSTNATLAFIRSGVDAVNGIGQVDTLQQVATRIPNLGVWVNNLPIDTVLTASPNGSHVLSASNTGLVLIYDANVNSFTVARQDLKSDSNLGGAYAASSFDQYVVGNHLLNSSGVPIALLNTTGGAASGFAFVDQAGYFTTAAGTSTPGVIATVDFISGRAIKPTQTIEAPILGAKNPSPNSTTTLSCDTAKDGTRTCTSTITVGTSVTSQTCTTSSATSGSNTTTTTVCTPLVSGTVVTPTIWTKSLAALADQSALISLSTSGFTVLPWSYASAVAPPQITKVVSAADGKSPVAPGGLINIIGNQLAPTNLATKQIPLPTALANSCLTVNGQPTPIIFVSPTQINAQLPFQAVGNVTMIVHTPGGVSDNFNLTVIPNAPAIFLTGVAGPESDLPSVVRGTNNLLATDSNPIHIGDQLTIYLTGMGQTTPSVDAGLPAPGDPLAFALTPPVVALGDSPLNVDFAGLAPGEVGVYQINVTVPKGVPTGLGIPLTILQGGSAHTVNIRVVE
jgi:uncharacterized protein (TIGR03437 family)